MKCPICGKEFFEKPTISRRDNREICPMCGIKEAMDDAGFTDTEQQKVIEIINKLNNERKMEA